MKRKDAKRKDRHRTGRKDKGSVRYSNDSKLLSRDFSLPINLKTVRKKKPVLTPVKDDLSRVEGDEGNEEED